MQEKISEREKKATSNDPQDIAVSVLTDAAFGHLEVLQSGKTVKFGPYTVPSRLIQIRYGHPLNFVPETKSAKLFPMTQTTPIGGPLRTKWTCADGNHGEKRDRTFCICDPRLCITDIDMDTCALVPQVTL